MTSEDDMDKPISVGDLVMVIRGMLCCGGGSHIGEMFVVRDIYQYAGGHCELCKAPQSSGLAAAPDHTSGGQALFRLKRIPPLEELEGEKRDEKIKEPA
jgi:hypothetical protein